MRGRSKAAGLVAFAALATTALPGTGQAAPSGGAVPPELVQVVDVTAVEGIPADVAMVALNVTAVAPAEPGFLTVFACDEDEPATSNVNYLADQVVPNLVLTRVADDGTVCIATHAVSDVLVDLVGYVPAGSAVQPLAAPVRAIDTRQTASTPRPAGSVLELPVAGQFGVAPDAQVVMFNATAIAGAQPGYLAAYPCGGAPPASSSVNYLPNQIVANMVTARVGANGSICIFTLATADIVVDVAAYATAGITPLAQPQRLADTRTSGRVPANGTLTLDVANRADVPDDATAAAYNLTAVNPESAGFVTSYPCDTPRPTVSNLNYRPRQIVANGAITKLSASGQLCLYSLATSDLIVDLVGYTQGSADYQPITPTRLLDTREGWQSQCDWRIIGYGTRYSTVILANFSDGRRITLNRPGPPTDYLPSLAIVDRTCSGVLWYLEYGYPADQKGVHLLGFDGSDMLIIPHVEAMNGFDGDQIAQLDDGRVVAVKFRDVRDVATGALYGQFPPYPALSGGFQEYVDIAGTGVAARWILHHGQGHLQTVELSTGTVLGERTIDNVQSPSVSISPNGTYVAVATGQSLSSGTDRAVLIFTAFGDLVEALPGPRTAIVDFTGNGQLILCLSNMTSVERDLFGDLRPVGVSCVA